MGAMELLRKVPQGFPGWVVPAKREVCPHSLPWGHSPEALQECHVA